MSGNSSKLTYKGKLSPGRVLKDTEGAELQKVKTYGQKVKTYGQKRKLGDWDSDWRNMLVFGDNLSVLRTLLDSYEGKVDLAYIDPPFSTEKAYANSNKEPAYEDFLVGSEFVEFLRRRLIFLRELLADSGSIYVHIDWKMGHYIKVVMDEIFGENHFINDIARIKCKPKNFPRPAYGNIKDIVLFYSKADNYTWNESREEMTDEDIQRLFPKVDERGRKYTTTPLHAPGETMNGPTGQPWKGLKPPKGRHWRNHPDELTKLDEEGLIEWSSTGNPRKKLYPDQARRKGKKRQDIWDLRDPQYPAYPTQKNSDMLKVIIEASSNPDDLVLDCFSGSGTTLVAAEELNRHWIGVDDSELAIKTSLDRLLSLKSYRAFSLFSASGESLRVPEAL